MQDFEDAGVTVILASRIEVMVPMRHGVRLRTVVCAPRGARASGEAEKDGVKEPSSWLTAPWLRPVLDPAVKAYSPQAPPADNFVGDDLFHQGAFRLSPMLEFVPAMYRTLVNQRPLIALLLVSTTGPRIMVAAEMLRGRFRR